ncbi:MULTISPECIES: suppressor of fused domain protein [Actinopolyspora]|uniref:Suppressor of fused protein (SUFU) n=1 Tax=Actinopolyspora saharensis TaxID=995062 RepID=A0A1H1EXQ4_9ACTN|nr:MULTISPECIES: suppressor of fused domain protein [Actinopolyspora]NHD18273.1 suppressor of fused domain protein [Actinopolyspora sp. BKK2]NHE77048.1 suppressor of fused domain protein [Actinopolyspora sp. BKK1]SDQ93517.1 Suppressor of fused protein (SUFU) [Actinopolyspora saharensis]
MNRFSGFPAHVEKYLGRIRGADSQETDSRERGYHLVYCDPPHGAHISVLTNGLRSHAAGAPLPHELVCTLHSGQELHARHLTGVIAELLEESNSRVGPGALIMNDRALLPETEISGALAAPHPYLGEDFDILRDETGEAVLRIITLLPISRGEAQLVARYGSDVLYDRWEQHDSDLLDAFRPSVA